MPPIDILALAAHRDDVEQTCGGTPLKMAQRGYRTGILDLTQGEMGTRGTAEDRAREAADVCGGYQRSIRGPLSLAHGLQVAIYRSERGQRNFPCGGGDPVTH